MKIAFLGLFCNESDIVESWCRHHAKFGELFVLNDSRADGTSEILRLLQAEGLPLTVWSSGMPVFDYRQIAATNAAIQRMLKVTDADWIIPRDADEFVVAPSREALEAELATVPYGACPCQKFDTYVPTSGDYFAHANPLHAIFRKRTPDGLDVPKAVVPRWALEQGAWMPIGSHITVGANGIGICGPALKYRLAHAPVRSEDQYIARMIQTGSKVYDVAQIPHPGGYAPPPLLRESNYQIDDATLYKIALNRDTYEPWPTGVDQDSRMVGDDIEIKYRDLARPAVFPVLAQHVEDLNAELCKCGGEPLPIDIERLRGELPRREAIAAIEKHVEKLCRAVHVAKGYTI
jgi:hypothetical protein